MPWKQHKKRRIRRGAVLLPALFCSLLLTGCGVLSVAGEGLLVKELGESRALIVGRLMRWAYGE